MGIPDMKLNFETFGEYRGEQGQSLRAIFVGETVRGNKRRYMVRYSTLEYLARPIVPEETRTWTAFRQAGVSQETAADILERLNTINKAIRDGKDTLSHYPLIRGEDYIHPNPFGVVLIQEPLQRHAEYA